MLCCHTCSAMAKFIWFTSLLLLLTSFAGVMGKGGRNPGRRSSTRYSARSRYTPSSFTRSSISQWQQAATYGAFDGTRGNYSDDNDWLWSGGSTTVVPPSGETTVFPYGGWFQGSVAPVDCFHCSYTSYFVGNKTVGIGTINCMPPVNIQRTPTRQCTSGYCGVGEITKPDKYIIIRRCMDPYCSNVNTHGEDINMQCCRRNYCNNVKTAGVAAVSTSMLGILLMMVTASVVALI